MIYGAACSYCLGRAKRLEGSYLRTFALELKEQLAQTLATFVMSILAEPRRHEQSAAEPPLRQIIAVLQQVMCTHGAEKLAISVLEIYDDGNAENELQSNEILCSNLVAPILQFDEPKRAPGAFSGATTCFCHRAAEWVEIEGIEKEKMSQELGKW